MPRFFIAAIKPARGAGGNSDQAGDFTHTQFGLVLGKTLQDLDCPIQNLALSVGSAIFLVPLSRDSVPLMNMKIIGSRQVSITHLVLSKSLSDPLFMQDLGEEQLGPVMARVIKDWPGSPCSIIILHP